MSELNFDKAFAKPAEKMSKTELVEELIQLRRECCKAMYLLNYCSGVLWWSEMRTNRQKVDESYDLSNEFIARIEADLT